MVQGSIGALREMGLAYHDPEAHLTTGSKSTHSSQLHSYVVDSLSLCPTAAANGDGCGELYAFHNLFLVAIPS